MAQLPLAVASEVLMIDGLVASGWIVLVLGIWQMAKALRRLVMVSLVFECFIWSLELLRLIVIS